MREKFTARTILVPLGGIAVFLILQILVMSVYTIVLTITESVKGADLDALDVEGLIMSHSNNIAAIYSALIIIAAVFFLNVLLIRNKQAVRMERPSIGLVVSSLLIMSGAAGVITLEMNGIYLLGEQIPFIDKVIQEYIELSEAFIGDGNVLMIILSTCILVPIAEELIFRGVIQGELRRVLPAWAAITIQAVIFALIHGNLLQISYVIIPAFILGITYEWTKSIYVPISLHMLFNFMGAALPEILNYDETAMLFLGIVEFALIPVGILAFFYLKAIRKIDPVPEAAITAAETAILQPADGVLPDETIWKHRDL